MTSSAPAGFKRPRRGGSSQSFLSDYLQGFFGSQNQPKMTPVATQSAPAQGESSGGFQIINPTTMMESSAASSQAATPGIQADMSAWFEAKKPYENWKPQVQQTGKDTYLIQDRRIPWENGGYGTPRMREVSGRTAEIFLDRINKGQYQPIVPNPSLAKTFSSGGLTVNTIPMGPNSYLSKGSVTSPMSLSEYNKAAADIYQQKYGKPFTGYTPDTNLAAGMAPTLDATRPHGAFASGMPIDIQGYTDFLTKRLGDPKLAAKRANVQIGGMLYREGVKQGYYEPGTYLHQGQQYNILR